MGIRTLQKIHRASTTAQMCAGAAVIFWLLQGCTPRWPETPVSVQQLTPHDIAVVRALNLSCGQELLRVVCRDCAAQVVTVWDEELEVEGRANYQVDAHYGYKSAQVFINPAKIKSKAAYQELLAHELVHVMGIKAHFAHGLMHATSKLGLVGLEDLPADPGVQAMCEIYRD